jgi:DivIVA domain-containing protein
MPDQSYAATEHALLEEITRPLERIPEEPLELVQADFPTAMRGYDRAAVDEYVRETSQLVAELQAVRSPEAAVRRALVRAGGMISGVLRRAHDTAAEITASSRSEAEDRLERARVEADEIMDAAEQRVRELDADTDRIWLDRQRIMADVEDLSGQLLGLAKEAGARFPDTDDEPVAYDDEAQPEAVGPEMAAQSDSAVEPDVRAEPEVTAKPAAEPAVWERWADASASDAVDETAGEPSPTALTDRDETLPLATPDDDFDPGEPPEVEPRSARLLHDDDVVAPPSPAEADRGSAGVIPPMSEAANRPRRT